MRQTITLSQADLEAAVLDYVAQRLGTTQGATVELHARRSPKGQRGKGTIDATCIIDHQEALPLKGADGA